ncbi:MAG: S1C family serine protease [Candidatus Heritagella sp.]
MSEERQSFVPGQEEMPGQPVIPQENEPAMPVPPAPEMPTGQPEARWTAVPGGMPPAPPVPPVPDPPQPPKAPRGQRRYLWFVGGFAAALMLIFIGYTVFCGINGGDTGLAPQTEPSAQEGQESRPGWPDVDPFGEEDSDPDGQEGSGDADSQLEKPQYPAPEISYSNSGITLQSHEGKPLLTKTEVFQKVTSSVVGIAARYTTSGGLSTISEGSGIIATEDGYIITNAHVVGETRKAEVVVYLMDGTTYGAVVVGYDRMTDLAVLKIDAHGLTAAEFGDSGELEVGEDVLAVGSPGGLVFQNTLTDGIVSALNRVVEGRSGTYIQTNTAINPGNSGGPLLNLYGQVIGINSSKIMATGYEGLGFAIPTQSAQQIVSDLISCGYVRGRPRLGITGYDTAASRDGSVPAGFTIDSIGEDSDFTRAGARRGDIITAVNGEEVSGLTELQSAVFQYAPGDTVTMTLYRPDEGRYLDIEVKLLADAGETQD